ncbi:unnamed protein product [Malus baccata var. baccata]
MILCIVLKGSIFQSLCNTILIRGTIFKGLGAIPTQIFIIHHGQSIKILCGNLVISFLDSLLCQQKLIGRLQSKTWLNPLKVTSVRFRIPTIIWCNKLGSLCINGTNMRKTSFLVNKLMAHKIQRNGV